MRNFNEEYSLVRFLHAAPNVDSVDVYVNGTSFYNDLDFNNFTPYVYMPKNTYTVEIFVVNSQEEPLIKQCISVSPEELITIAIIVVNGKLELLVISEDMEIASGRNSKVRFVHLVPNGRDVNIIIDENMEVSNLGYTDVTSYQVLAPKEYRIDLEAVEKNQIIRSIKIKINPNRIYTFYAIGEAPNFDIIQSLDGATFLI